MIDSFELPSDWRACDLGSHVASRVLPWLQAAGLPPRDAVLLVPYSALLAPLRLALAGAGGWQPRVETPLTLAATLGPPVASAPGQCSGDPVLDRLCGRALLQRQGWARAWAADDAAGFERIVANLVDTAQTLRDGAAQRAPGQRAAYWAQARSLVGAASGPAAAEALLLQLALAWAEAAAPAATDRLFDLQPSAWIVLRIGGPVAVAEALLDAGRVPGLLLRADAPADAPFDAVSSQPAVQRWLCSDFEAEAQAAATEVIHALQAGRAPVALVALDREGVRRTRALLERDAVPLIDETGWVLATTRAAASVLALLRAAQAGAGQDTLLDWLKTWPPAPPRALDALEALWRGRRQVPQRDAAEALWLQAQQHLLALAGAHGESSAGGDSADTRRGATLPLAQWLQRLHDSLAADGSLQRLLDDAAGSQLIAALHLQAEGPPAWQQAARELRLSLAGFTAWMQSTLEQLPFLPTPPAQAAVIITPLARAVGRPFGHVVVPGADHRHLGGGSAAPSLLTDTMAQALGLEHAAQRRERQQAALAHLLRGPGLSLLRRHQSDDGPLTESPLVEWLLLSRERQGLQPWPLQPWQPAIETRARRPVPHPLPVAPEALPTQLSATQVEALRACPYRFFARAVLRLEDSEEIDTTLAKRDYGNWLHAVLHRFHAEREHGVDAAAQLVAAADHVTRAQGLDAGEMLPWRASFDTFAPAYLAWCRQREAAGWFWADGESDHRSHPPELPGVLLRGRIDRLDHGPDGGRQLLDYKTGSLSALSARVKEPLEDTQLAFYAALLGATPELGAAYVALDAADAPRVVEHAKVHESATTLLVNLGDEWQRLRAGAPMPALGEGAVCEYCEMRGLCRRDHWAVSDAAPVAGQR